jgi:hypothetical protein
MRGGPPIATAKRHRFLPLVAALAALASLASACTSSTLAPSATDGASSADAADASNPADATDATDANAPCAESLAAWCARGGHACVADLDAAIAPDSPYCAAIWGVAWTDGGCGAFEYVLVADSVDQVTKYVYAAGTRQLVAVMDQTTIIESCLAGAPGVVPPRSCGDPRNDPKTCCTPTGGGTVHCAPADAGNDGGSDT